MTSQQEADAALAIYQANRDAQERMDRLLKDFFAQVRADEYEEQLERVYREMAKCLIYCSDLPPHLSGAL